MRISQPARLRPTLRLGKGLAALAVGFPLLTAAGWVIWPAAAGASETITFSYDARGRLKTVAHSGTVNNGKTTTYTLDKADNRTAKTTT